MEQWKRIEGYEDYVVSNMGNVASFTNKSKGKLLKPQINRKGYLYVALYREGVRKQFYIHRLVAEAFIVNLFDEPQINHIDENKQNNRVDNLEYCTKRYNIRYSRAKAVIGINGDKSIVLQALRDAPFYNLDRRAIQRVLRGKLKHYKGYKWSYV